VRRRGVKASHTPALSRLSSLLRSVRLKPPPATFPRGQRPPQPLNFWPYTPFHPPAAYQSVQYFCRTRQRADAPHPSPFTPLLYLLPPRPWPPTPRSRKRFNVRHLKRPSLSLLRSLNDGTIPLPLLARRPLFPLPLPCPRSLPCSCRLLSSHALVCLAAAYHCPSAKLSPSERAHTLMYHEGEQLAFRSGRWLGRGTTLEAECRRQPLLATETRAGRRPADSHLSLACSTYLAPRPCSQSAFSHEIAPRICGARHGSRRRRR
jgi:hypothetical protein